MYRAENDALESEIECHVKDSGIVPRSVETVSHADAMYKSFKLTVSVNDMGKVLDADFWPEGIMVRRYSLDIISKMARIIDQLMYIIGVILLSLSLMASTSDGREDTLNVASYNSKGFQISR